MQIVCNKILLTEVISPHGDDAASSGVDWDLREGARWGTIALLISYLTLSTCVR